MLDAYTRGSMQDKAGAFLDIQNQYFSDKKNDADMTEYTTQAFWQSMYLSKKRLQEKDLTTETIVEKSAGRMFFHLIPALLTAWLVTFEDPFGNTKKSIQKTA